MSTSPYYNKIQVDIKVDNLEQQIANVADGASGKAYPDLESAMGVIPLPDNGIIFTIDETNDIEKGVYAYDSTEINGYRLVRTFDATGKVEEGNTQAVSGGEVFKSVVEDISIDSHNDWTPGYFRTNGGSEVIPPTNTYGLEKTPKILLEAGKTLKYGVNTFSNSTPAILITFYLNGDFKQTITHAVSAGTNVYYEGEYTPTEDVLVSIGDYTLVEEGERYVEIHSINELSIKSLKQNIDNLGISEINNKLDLLKKGAEIFIPQQDKEFSLTSFYYRSNGNISPNPYGHTRTPKFLLKKGEKLKYGVNVYTITGSGAILNTYTTEDVFKENILRPTTPTLASFLEGEYEATEDVLIGMSDYTGGAYGSAYAYIEAYEYYRKGVIELSSDVDKLNEKIENISVAGLEQELMYERGRAVQNLSTVKKYGIIVAGQSNTDGRVPIAQAPSYITDNDNTVPNVLMWNGGTKAFAPFKFGTNTGSSAGTTTSTLYAYDAIASYLLAQNKSQNIYLIKTARGGTAIDVTGSDGGGYWTPYTEVIPSGKLKLIEDLKLKVLTALKDNPDLEIKAILWHQGEGDSATATARVKYYQNFKNVIAYIRGIVGNPKLPFIFGTIAPVSAQYSTEVDEAFNAVFEEDPFVYKVDMSDGTLLDSWHFDATSTNNLGQRMFDILKDL